MTIRVDGTTRQAIADQTGQFRITEAPVGPVHLIADGSTSTVEGEFPSLSYNVVTVSGVENPLASPIYMVKLNTENAVYAGLEDVELTLNDVPGFKLEVKAGSVTFPDGSKEGNISVTAVNANKVPMAPPNGMQPQFIVTIQPTGAQFDPPAPLTLPNVDGHAPGAQVEMFSYDHDLEEFVAIGLGTVSEDGTVIKTNPGVGVIKAGWHCGAQPGGDGCCSGPERCQEYCAKPDSGCSAGCSIDLEKSMPEDQQTPNDCAQLTCGGTQFDESDPPLNDPHDCVNAPCTGPPAPDDGEQPDPGNDCKVCQGGSAQNAPDGAICGDECGECTGGSCSITDPNKPKSTQTVHDCETVLCDGTSQPDPDDRPACNESCQDFNPDTCSCELKPAHEGVDYGLCSQCGPNGEAQQRTSGSCTPRICWVGDCSAEGCINQRPADDYIVSTCKQCVNGALVPRDDPLCEDDPCQGFSELCKECTVVDGVAVISNVDGPVPGNPCAVCSGGETVNNAAGICSDGDECTTGDHCENQACVPTGVDQSRPECEEPEDGGDVTVRLTMFIPIDHIKMPEPLWLSDEIFTGDNRTFAGSNFDYYDQLNEPEPQPDLGVTYRIAQQFTYRPGVGIIDPVHLSGYTERFDLETSMTSIVGGPPSSCYRKSCPQCKDYDLYFGLAYGPMHVENSCITTEARRDTDLGPAEDKKEERRPASVSSLDVKVVEQTASKIKILMEGDPANSIVPFWPVAFTPTITWQIFVELNLSNAKVNSWRIVGAGNNNAAHDPFPAYELEINKSVIYTYDPIPNGKNPGHLDVDEDEQVELDISGML